MSFKYNKNNMGPAPYTKNAVFLKGGTPHFSIKYLNKMRSIGMLIPTFPIKYHELQSQKPAIDRKTILLYSD